MVLNAIGAILIPIFSLPLNIWAFRKNEMLRNIILFILTSLIFVLVLGLVPAIKAGGNLSLHVFSMLSVWEIFIQVDPFGLLFAMLSSGLWIFTVLYAIGYMKGYKNQSRFFIFLILSLGITMGVAFSGNLFTLYLFYEILTFITYPLVVHFQSKEALKAGRKYLTYSLSGAALILLGLILTYSLTGSLSFAKGGLFAGNIVLQEGGWVIEFLFTLFVLGFGVKAAIMPLHGWLPSAMVAPTPVSALFHAVAVVNSGLFGLIRVLYGVFGIELLKKLMMGKVFMILVLGTIVVGSAIAFLQENLKKRLAYSTISQLGYITLGVSLLNPDGWRGGIIHIFNHALLKITLFFCAGIIYKMTHKKKISEMHGIGKKMPLTMTAFTIATLGMIGIPPSNGFISKWYLLQGAFKAGSMLTIFMLLLSALLNAGYFFPIIINAFFKKETEDLHIHEGKLEAPAIMLIPVLIIAISTLLIGIWPQIPLWLVERSIEMMGVVD
ncbi:MAG: monovalent cation/H+ antiporter subunit D family protein [Halanaerobiales bacterium]|nr:monovalent cation/H+ antiporter subunit D family protein [Halanaerobiales bacterium]